MESFERNYGVDEVICRMGDPSTDLLFLKSGKLLVCMVSGTEVKPLAEISPGEFIGELAFFDGKKRSSHIVALEVSVVVQIPKHELIGHLPDWYQIFGKNLTKKIRLLDDVVNASNIRKSSISEQKPLPIDRQRALLEAITHQDT